MKINKKEKVDDSKPSLERRMEIINLVGVRGKIHVDELAEHYNVTGATIRTDLRFLEQQEYIVRAHGYAMVNRAVISKLAKSQKEEPKNSTNAVEFIANAIYEVLDNQNTLFLDSSPLIRDALKSLSDLKHSTVVTHDLNLVDTLIHINNSQTFLTGGKLDTNSMKLTGSKMINSLRQYRFNNAIVHADSFNLKLGLFVKSEFDCDLIKLLGDLSEKITLVGSASIFESNAHFWVCDATSIDTVIIDGQLSKEITESLKRSNIKIIN